MAKKKAARRSYKKKPAKKPARRKRTPMKRGKILIPEP